LEPTRGPVRAHCGPPGMLRLSAATSLRATLQERAHVLEQDEQVERIGG
jgi:hypothetical protein